MADLSAPVRSYQRIFRADRRIYQVDGRRLPVPGGVPLAWIAWMLGAELAVLALAGRSLLLSGIAAALAASAGSLRGWRGALAGACVALVGMQLAGLVLDWVAWPLRLVVLPAAVATGACQVSAEGRPAHRYLACQLLWWLRVKRSSLGRPLGTDGAGEVWAPGVWIAPDAKGTVLVHGRVSGPARLVFAEPVLLTRRRGRHVVRPVGTHRERPGDVRAEVVELDEGQVIEVRP